MNNRVLTLLSQEHSIGYQQKISLSLTLNADSWLRSQIQIYCLIYSIVSKECGTEVGWDCSLDKLLIMVGSPCSAKELELLLSDACECDYLPGYEIVLYEPTRQVLFLNKLEPERQQYFSRYLMGVSEASKSQSTKEIG